MGVVEGGGGEGWGWRGEVGCKKWLGKIWEMLLELSWGGWGWVRGWRREGR